jgi:hypothetical protein
MRGYRYLSALCLTAMLIFGMLAVHNLQGDPASQLAPRLTQTASHTFTPGGTTETPTATPTTFTEITVTPTPMAYTVELLINGGFEEADALDEGQAHAWLPFDRSRDKRKCKAPKAYEGECYYQFRNGPNEQSKLLQSVTSESLLSEGMSMTLSGAYLAKGDPRLQIIVYVMYRNRPLEKLVIRLNEVTNDLYQPVTSSSLLILGDVETIQVLILNKGTFGKVLLDDLHLTAVLHDDVVVPPRLGLP